MQVFVFGMHRSGTSMVSRLLNFLGFSLGDEKDLMQARIDNPAGFWERRDTYELNEDILREAASSWDTARGDEIECLQPPKREEFSRRIADILEIMNSSRQWVMKDPRFCMTFSLWRGLLEKPVAVFVYRDPAQVAASLETRNGLPRVVGISLCESYSLGFLKAAKGIPQIFIRHDQLLADPAGTSFRLCDELEDLGASGLRRSCRQEVESFIDDRLYRSREDPSGIIEYLNDQRRRLFADLASGQPSGSWTERDLSRDSGDTLRLFRDFRDVRGHTTGLEEEIRALHHHQSILGGQKEELEKVLDRERDLRDSQADSIHDLLASEIRAIGHRLDELAESNCMLREELKEARTETREWKAHTEESRKELDRIHHSKFWRIWMIYHWLRRRILHPLSPSGQSAGRRESPGGVSG